MSTRSLAGLAKTRPEYWKFVLREFQKEHPGAFSDDDLLDWAIKNNVPLNCWVLGFGVRVL